MNSERTGWPLRGGLGQCKFKKEIMFPGNEPLDPFLLCSTHLPHLLETSSSEVVNGAVSVPGLPPIENLKKKKKRKREKFTYVQTLADPRSLFVPCLGHGQIFSSPSVCHFYLRMWGEFIGLKSVLFGFVPPLFPGGPT